jgi:hypothetical protein
MSFIAPALSDEAQNVNWMLARLVEDTVGVDHAICVSSDGLLMAASSTVDRAAADQLAAIVSGMTSLSVGASRVLDLGGINQIIVDMHKGFLFVSSISDGSALGVLADASCDIGVVGYEMTLLVDRFGGMLTPTLVAELKSALPA